MKVLISDNLGQEGVRIFQEEEGIEVDVKTGLSPDELKAIIGDYDALVIRSATKVTADLLSAAKKLKVVGRAGIGLDNVDIPAATKKGVVVMNTPGGNVVTTAEHAISMMMALTRNIPQATASMKQGLWEKKKFQGWEIMNKTLGVIGFGKIGSVVADRARGLKMRVVVYDPIVQPDIIEKSGFEWVSLEELYKQADYITIHVPKGKTTLGMVNAEAFEMMKKGVMIINCARGGIIDEDALYTALTSGKVAGAALDVFSAEPPPADLPLLKLDNVIFTPHLGASTEEAQTNVAVAVANQIIEYLKYNNIINAVNVPAISGKLLEKLRPFLFLADRMGCLLAQYSAGQLKEVQIEYRGDFSGLDMSPVTTALIKGLLDVLIQDGVNSVNAPVIAKDMGVKISESSTAEALEYLNLISANIVTTDMERTVSGTVFGKSDARIVKIDKFRIEMVPQGHLALIHNIDEPGAIGSVGTVLGEHKVNISKMQVGMEEGGNNNIILIRTDTPIPDDVVAKVNDLPKVNSIKVFEL
ncbi:MAG: phosphoglycerate dehydrogenase [Desulfobacteraceae bacterium]|jgi:D-3-phosphoglycerate dehydrogenase|nr:MAG: phosphoglycerate dehydrogenase [Desulfobacteraceae bacterium]